MISSIIEENIEEINSIWRSKYQHCLKYIIVNDSTTVYYGHNSLVEIKSNNVNVLYDCPLSDYFKHALKVVTRKHNIKNVLNE
jgi:hypothetical protein